MKTNFLNENTIIVFLNYFLASQIDFTVKEDLESYFKTLFLRLNEIYNIEINGYYNITVYPDIHYGAVLYIEKEELEYMDLWDNQIDMRIAISKYDTFLYKVDDILTISKNVLKKGKIYSYQNNFYLKLEEDISLFEMGQLLEISTIIYGRDAEDLLRHGKVVELQI